MHSEIETQAKSSQPHQVKNLDKPLAASVSVKCFCAVATSELLSKTTTQDQKRLSPQPTLTIHCEAKGNCQKKLTRVKSMRIRTTTSGDEPKQPTTEPTPPTNPTPRVAPVSFGWSRCRPSLRLLVEQTQPNFGAPHTKKKSNLVASPQRKDLTAQSTWNFGQDINQPSMSKQASQTQKQYCYLM